MTEEFDWQLISPEGCGPLYVIATKKEIQDYRSLFSENCDHNSREIRDFKTSNGGWQRKEQCLICGKSASNPVTRNKNVVVPGWDYDLTDNIGAARRERRLVIENLLIERTANLEESGYEYYEEYLKSDEWKKRRLLVFKRDGKTCQACLSEAATEIHHLTNDRIFSEPLFDLVAVCRPCHEKLHVKKLIAKEAARAKSLVAQIGG